MNDQIELDDDFEIPNNWSLKLNRHKDNQAEEEGGIYIYQNSTIMFQHKDTGIRLFFMETINADSSTQYWREVSFSVVLWTQKDAEGKADFICKVYEDDTVLQRGDDPMVVIFL